MLSKPIAIVFTEFKDEYIVHFYNNMAFPDDFFMHKWTVPRSCCKNTLVTGGPLHVFLRVTIAVGAASYCVYVLFMYRMF